MIIPFASQSYKHDSLPISAQRVVNMYAEAHPQTSGAKAHITVHGSPGITTFATADIGPIRGLYFWNGLLYAVSGPWLYSISNDSVPKATRLGGQISGSGVVEMSDNGTSGQLTIVNGTNGYIYSPAAGFLLVTNAAFNAANTVAFIDEVFAYDWAKTSKFFISALLDGTSFDATQFATAEAHSDNVLAVHNLNQLLYVLKERSFEVWQDTGAINFPFALLPGTVKERGIIGSHARTQEDQALFFVGNDRISYRMDYMQPMRNSTHPIEQAWAAYATVSDCFGVRYTWKGHKFINFTFPSIPATWVYDVATGLWHERESRDRNGVNLRRWRVNAVTEAYGMTMCGDSTSGKVGFLDASNVSTEFGDTFYAHATGPVLHADQTRAFMSLFELDMEAGVGLTSGQGSNPQVMLEISDDGGRTWGDQQIWNSLGQLGAYRQRLRWKRLGNFFQRDLRVSISDPVRRTIIRANAEVKVGL